MTENTYLTYGECYQVMPREAVQRPICMGYDMARGSDSTAVVNVKLTTTEESSGQESIKE